jgi:cell division protein FtsZ
MDRRRFLKGLGAGAVGLTLPAVASATGSASMGTTADNSRLSGSRSSARSCKIIGIGGAGCNCVLAMQSGAALDSAEYVPEFICVDLGGATLPYIEADSRPAGGPPIKTMSLGPLGAGGQVNYARAAALRNREALKSMLAEADVVLLVAGLGGGTGSGVTPIMAHLTREAGVRTVAVVCITPFEFEGPRHRTADTALRYLQREADLVVTLSNETWANGYSEDTPMIDIFTSLDRHIAGCIRGLMDRANPA